MEKQEQIEKLKLSLERLTNKQNKIMFYLPSIPQASGGIGVVYTHAKKLQEDGYDVMILHDEGEYAKPEWLGSEYCNLKHLSVATKPTIYPEDVLVYPEGFPNIMEQTKNLNCIKIVLCQSHAYVLSGLVPGMSWANFGIKNVIVVQEPLKEYLESVFGVGLFDIKTTSPSIDNDIFSPTKSPIKPIIAVSARNQQDLLALAKHFYSAYPQYRMISFKDMRDMSRKDFAETLKECCFAVWIDRVAGFGTFPIECAKSGVPFLGLVPDMIPEYADDKVGLWVQSTLELPNVTAKFVTSWMEDTVPSDIYENLNSLASKYTSEEETEQIKSTYKYYLDNRVEEILKNIEKLEKDGE